MSNLVEPTLFRLRVAYPKQGRLKYLGHLEVIHTVEQIVRRAHLPYAVTQGFSPHMRIAYTSALPVGTSSTCEYFDVILTELVPVADALARLQAAAPKDLLPFAAGYLDMRTPNLTAQITRVEYKVLLKPASVDVNAKHVEQALEDVCQEGSIAYKRGKKEKVLDLNRTLANAFVSKDAHGLCLMLDTRCDNEGAMRPELLLSALDRKLRRVSVEEEPVVSQGAPQLASFSHIEIERINQYIETQDGSWRTPLELNL